MGDKQRDDTNRKYLNEIARRLIVCHFELEFRYMLADMRFALFAFYSARRKSTLQWFQLVAKIYGTHHSTIVCKQRLLWRISYYECERIWVEDTHTHIRNSTHNIATDTPINVWRKCVCVISGSRTLRQLNWMDVVFEGNFISKHAKLGEKKTTLSLLVLYTFPFHPSIRREIATTTPSEYTMAEVFPCLLFIFTSFFSFFLFVFSYIFFHDIRHAQRDRTEFRNAQVEWGVSVSTCKVDDDNGANNKTSS